LLKMVVTPLTKVLVVRKLNDDVPVRPGPGMVMPDQDGLERQKTL